ncbi:hypothetical protein ACEWAL_22970, partial [Vibrio parahaemolyticus]
YLLPVSQLRSHRSIELPDRRTLVAAKVWVSPYPIGVLIIHTNSSRGIQHAWHFWYALALVLNCHAGTSVLRASPLNWALVANEKNVPKAEFLRLMSMCF